MPGFGWDEQKRSRNLEKHGIDFPVAAELFDGRPILTTTAPRYDEERWKSIGRIGEDFITVIWTWRETNIRLISARRARHEEKQGYRRLCAG